MRFTFFEYVFFVSAFGTLALFTGAQNLLPLLTLPAYAFTIALTGITTLIGLTLYEKNQAHSTRKKAFGIAALTGCVALLISMLGQATSAAFALWSLNAVLAVFTFGSILARRFFRRVERDFRRNMAHILVIGLAINMIGLFAANTFAVFPPVMTGILTAAITLVALL
jgi:lysylphosphatidylglycerol synthetase-like protein (DUF2156 family)